MGKEVVSDAFKANSADRQTTIYNRVEGLFEKLRSLSLLGHPDIAFILRFSKNTGLEELFGDMHVFSNLEKPELMDFLSDFEKQVSEPHVHFYGPADPCETIKRSSVKTENNVPITNSMLALKHKVYSTKFPAYLRITNKVGSKIETKLVEVDPTLWHSKEKKTMAQLESDEHAPLKRYGKSEYFVVDKGERIWLTPPNSRIIPNGDGTVKVDVSERIVTKNGESVFSKRGPQFRRIIKATRDDYFQLSKSVDTIPSIFNNECMTSEIKPCVAEGAEISRKKRYFPESQPPRENKSIKLEHPSYPMQTDLSFNLLGDDEIDLSKLIDLDDPTVGKLEDVMRVFNISNDKLFGTEPTSQNQQRNVCTLAQNHRTEHQQGGCMIRNTILIPVKKENPDVDDIINTNSATSRKIKTSTCLTQMKKGNEALKEMLNKSRKVFSKMIPREGMNMSDMLMNDIRNQ